VIFVFAIGAIKLLIFIIGSCCGCGEYCCRGRQNLKAKYGRENGESYAVVTGGTEGLGLELCDQLAEQGFNIAIVSRNL